MRSALMTLESRWAMMSVVRFSISRSSAAWMTDSFSASTLESASSRSRIDVSFSSARAIASLCRCPARQPDRALADDGVVALGQVRNELVGIGRAGGLLQLLLRRTRLPEPQVLGDGAVEEVRVLR